MTQLVYLLKEFTIKDINEEFMLYSTLYNLTYGSSHICSDKVTIHGVEYQITATNTFTNATILIHRLSGDNKIIDESVIKGVGQEFVNNLIDYSITIYEFITTFRP